MKNGYKKKKKMTSGDKRKLVTSIVVIVLIIVGGFLPDKDRDIPKDTGEIETVENTQTESEQNVPKHTESFDLSNIPEFTGNPYVEINSNVPDFTADELSKAKTSYKNFSQLDSLGRCGTAEASIGKDLLPTEDRTSIGMIKPSGWHTVRYDDLVDGNYLYNRCHLIAFCLSGENANRDNLITGTRYMNCDGMLPFEEKTVRFVEDTGKHVLYRVTPVFNDNELVARGVHMEAKSVEDNGQGLSFNIYCYNNQPGISIDYSTGLSERK